MKWEELLQELMLVAGFASFGYGLWMAHPAAALVVCGALLMWAGYPKRRAG